MCHVGRDRRDFNLTQLEPVPFLIDSMSKKRKTGIGTHHSTKMLNDEWLTPPEIIRDLGPFDCDPCSPVIRPWDTAKIHYTLEDNGLMKDWEGMVWMNPPYGKEITYWFNKLAMHNNGIALIFARTETKVWQFLIWPYASCFLFIYDRLYFYDVEGKRSISNSGGPSVLIAYGEEAKQRLLTCSIKGKLLINDI